MRPLKTTHARHLVSLASIAVVLLSSPPLSGQPVPSKKQRISVSVVISAPSLTSVHSLTKLGLAQRYLAGELVRLGNQTFSYLQWESADDRKAAGPSGSRRLIFHLERETVFAKSGPTAGKAIDTTRLRLEGYNERPEDLHAEPFCSPYGTLPKTIPGLEAAVLGQTSKWFQSVIVNGNKLDVDVKGKLESFLYGIPISYDAEVLGNRHLLGVPLLDREIEAGSNSTMLITALSPTKDGAKGTVNLNVKITDAPIDFEDWYEKIQCGLKDFEFVDIPKQNEWHPEIRGLLERKVDGTLRVLMTHYEKRKPGTAGRLANNPGAAGTRVRDKHAFQSATCRPRSRVPLRMWAQGDRLEEGLNLLSRGEFEAACQVFRQELNEHAQGEKALEIWFYLGLTRQQQAETEPDNDSRRSHLDEAASSYGEALKIDSRRAPILTIWPRFTLNSVVTPMPSACSRTQ